MEETVAVKANLLQYAKYTTTIMLLLVLGQAMTGVGGATDTGLALTASHTYSAMLGLILAIATVGLIMASKTVDKKMKGFGFEILTIWIVMYGLGEMSMAVNHKLSMIHAAIGLILFARLMMMVKVFPGEQTE
ncbi:MAG: hypothetical protein ACKVIR_08260 [Candidatus Poseidoniales archaeon]